jgi:hypothetical protein
MPVESENPTLMMPVRQNPGTQSKNEKNTSRVTTL